MTGKAVDRLLPAAARALARCGLDVERNQVNPGLARLILARGDDRTQLDRAAERGCFRRSPVDRRARRVSDEGLVRQPR